VNPIRPSTGGDSLTSLKTAAYVTAMWRAILANLRAMPATKQPESTWCYCVSSSVSNGGTSLPASQSRQSVTHTAAVMAAGTEKLPMSLMAHDLQPPLRARPRACAFHRSTAPGPTGHGADALRQTILSENRSRVFNSGRMSGIQPNIDDTLKRGCRCPRQSLPRLKEGFDPLQPNPRPRPGAPPAVQSSATAQRSAQLLSFIASCVSRPWGPKPFHNGTDCNLDVVGNGG